MILVTRLAFLLSASLGHKDEVVASGDAGQREGAMDETMTAPSGLDVIPWVSEVYRSRASSPHPRDPWRSLPCSRIVPGTQETLRGKEDRGGQGGHDIGARV